ncbi:ribonuclease H-like domain-containing protein [Tanacetum coccineum]
MSTSSHRKTSEPFESASDTSLTEEKVSTDRNLDAPIIEDWESDKEDQVVVKPDVVKIDGTNVPKVVSNETVKPTTNIKPDRKTVRYCEMYRSTSKRRGNQRNWNNLKSQQLGDDFVMYRKACFTCGSFDHLEAFCHNHQGRKMVIGNNMVIGNSSHRVNSNRSQTHPSANRMTPRTLLLKSGLKPISTARPAVSTARPFKTVYPRPAVSSAKSTFKRAQQTVKRPFQKKAVVQKQFWKPKAKTARTAVSTASQAVSTGNSKNTAGLSILGHSQDDEEDQDFQPTDGGYVTFGGGIGGRIIGKGTLKTGKLYFEDVYFVQDMNYMRIANHTKTIANHTKTADEDIYDKIKSVLYTDSDVAGEGACISMGLLMVKENAPAIVGENSPAIVEQDDIVEEEKVRILIGDPVPDAKARKQWPHRYLLRKKIVITGTMGIPRGNEPICSFKGYVFACNTP